MIKALKPRIADAGFIKIGMIAKAASGKTHPKKLDEFRITTLERDRANLDNLVDDHRIMWYLRRHNAPEALRNKIQAKCEDETRAAMLAQGAGEELTKAAQKIEDPRKRADFLKVELLKQVKVRRIPITLHADDIDKILETEYTCFLGPSARHKTCDGESCWKYEIKTVGGVQVQTGKRTQIPCECPKGPSGLVSARFKEGDEPKHVCRPHGVFRCLLNLPGASGAGALYRFDTHGYDSILHLLGSLQDIQALCHGHLTNVPCLLVLHRGHGKDADGKKTSHWAVHVEMDVDLIEALQRLRRVQEARAELDAPQQVRQLASTGTPIEDPAGEQAALVAEFFPQSADGSPYDPDTGEVMDVDFDEVPSPTPTPESEPSPPLEVPQPEPPQPESPPDSGPPPMADDPPEQPIAKDDERWKTIAQRFRKLCDLEKISGPDDEKTRDARWRGLCQQALGDELSTRPTPTQADKMIERLEQTLAAKAAASTTTADSIPSGQQTLPQESV